MQFQPIRAKAIFNNVCVEFFVCFHFSFPLFYKIPLSLITCFRRAFRSLFVEWAEVESLIY